MGWGQGILVSRYGVYSWFLEGAFRESEAGKLYVAIRKNSGLLAGSTYVSVYPALVAESGYFRD